MAIALSIAALSASQAHAVPMTVDCGFGPTSCIFDPDTNLKWLQPTVTQGLSVDVVTDLLATAPYSGFEYATLVLITPFLDLMAANLGLLSPTSGPFTFALYDDEVDNGQSLKYLFIDGSGFHADVFSVQDDPLESGCCGSALVMSQSTSSTSVPEPSALSLMLFGGIGALASRWRRRKARSSSRIRNRHLV